MCHLLFTIDTIEVGSDASNGQPFEPAGCLTEPYQDVVHLFKRDASEFLVRVFLFAATTQRPQDILYQNQSVHKQCTGKKIADQSWKFQ